MNKLAIIEPSKTGAEHLSFNSSIIRELIRSYSLDNISLFCSRSHFDALAQPKTPFRSLPVVSIVLRRFVLKALVEGAAILLAFTRLRSAGIRHAIVLSVFPPLLNWLGFVSTLFGVHTTIILHGELEGLVDQSRQRVTSYGFWVKRFFERDGFKVMKCIVLSEGIMQRLTKIYPTCTSFIVWANHPIAQASHVSENRDITFATVGVATEKKHLVLFETMSKLAAAGYFCAHVGMTEEYLFKRYSKSIKFLCEPGSHLSVKEFDLALRRVSNAIFPYSPNSYQMTVSGAMLDAIGSGCHVISLPNTCAEDMRRSGLPVTIAESVEDLFATNTLLPPQSPCWDQFSAREFCLTLLIGSGLMPMRTEGIKPTGIQ